jgi:hypothetical protein
MTEEAKIKLLKKAKIKFDHWYAQPWTFSTNAGWVYGRVLGKTLYFSDERAAVLGRYNGEYEYKRLLRHEIEHLYQSSDNYSAWVGITYGWDYLKGLFTTGFNSYDAYRAVRWEKEARAAENLPLEDYEIAFLEGTINDKF